MKMQKLYSYVRQALDTYEMVQENDRIAIGISGGKDSLTLLYALAGLRKFYPKKFEICAITVDLGYPNFNLTLIQDLCNELEVEYHIVSTKIGEIVEQSDKRLSPCSLCSKLRKGALNNEAVKLGCNKIAYAHHMDDMIETMFLSLIYEGRFYCFPPVTYLEQTKLTVIRPLMLVPEVDIIGFGNKYPLPTVKNACPYDGHTRRAQIKDLVKQLHMQYPGIKKRLFHAIVTGNIEDWRIENQKRED